MKQFVLWIGPAFILIISVTSVTLMTLSFLTGNHDSAGQISLSECVAGTSCSKSCPDGSSCSTTCGDNEVCEAWCAPYSGAKCRCKTK